MPSNRAAWLTAEKKRPLEVEPAPYTPPGENEIVIKNGAVAINPVDWKIQDAAIFPLDYPAIIGEDAAGEVVEVGSSVSRFKKGDRVLGYPVAIGTKRPCDGSFQEYTVLLAHLASPIPSSLSFDRAAVMPLALSTAAAALFQKDHLGLSYPSLDPKPIGKAVLIWGGASSVGSMAIQLAAAAGYEVITTASPKNFVYVKELGATQVLDYHSKTIVNDILNAFEQRSFAGALDAIGGEALQRCIEVVQKVQGKKVIATTPAPPENQPDRVIVQFVLSLTIKDNEVSKVIYEDFLPKALEKGLFLPAPDPQVIGKGLEHIQAGIDAQKKGISAKKIVITL